jgi:hypothetical protein
MQASANTADVNRDFSEFGQGRQGQMAFRFVHDGLDVFRMHPHFVERTIPTAASFIDSKSSSPAVVSIFATAAATSHFDWLISITAMIVLSCSRAVRDLLASK